MADLELPIHFITGSMSTYSPLRPNLLVVSSILPTAKVLADNISGIPRLYGVNPRLISALRTSFEVIPYPQMKENTL